MIDEDFRAFVQSRAAPGVPMEKGRVSEEFNFAATPVRIYYQRSMENREVALNRDPMITETVFDVEVGSLSDDDAQSIADRVKLLCNGYQGALDKAFVHGMFAQDHTDDYQPRFLDADQGIYGAAFQVQLFHVAMPFQADPVIV